MATGVRITVGQQPVQVDPGPGLRVWQYPTKPVQPITNVSETAQAAVADPVGFPALSLAVVDGDRVVITADADIPRLSDILFGLAQSLRPHNVNLSVLLGESAQGELLHVLKQRLGDAVEIVVHDPDDAGQLGYLAATEKADPIYLNRRLLDADFVLPVMLARMSSSMDTDPLSGHIFPQFADRVSQRRVRTDALLSPTAESPEPSEVAWLLGLQLMVGVVPASGDQLAAIIAGTQETIGKALAEPVQKVYRFDRPATEPAGAPDLVVACVDGNSQQQTWENIARAVSAGLRMVKPGGTVAVCSALNERPGPALRKLRGQEANERLFARLAGDEHADALAAAVLLRSRGEARVLLQTRLSREVVEELGFGVIADSEELGRLMRQHQRCAILASAQFCP